MNKLFTKIAALALGAAMVVGVGVAINSKNVGAAHAAEELAFHFSGSSLATGTSYQSWSGSVSSSTTSKVSTATWQITVGNNSAQLGTNAKSGNLSKTTLGNGNFSAASGVASALSITTTTTKYAAVYCTTGMSYITKGELIFTGTNGGNITQAWLLSSTNGTSWTIESTKSSSITSGSTFSVTKSATAKQFAFVCYWNLTNAGGLKGFQYKLYGEYDQTGTITASADSAYSDESVTLTSNATSATWSITSGGSYAHLSSTSGKSVSLVGDAAGSVTVKAVASGYTDATKTITFNERPAGTFYDVTFDSNGGSSSPAKQSVEEDNTFTFPSPGTKTHYTFAGWSSDGGSTKYATGATSPAVVADIEYTAYWTEDAKVTVTYNAGTNASGSYSHTNQYIGSYSLLALSSLSGITYDSTVYRLKDYVVGGVSKQPGESITLSAATTVTVNFEEIPLEYEIIFGTAEGTSGITDFSNSSYVIPSGVTLNNIQGNVYSNTSNQAASLRFGKSGTTGSFDATISGNYYITSVKCNLKYYGSDTTATFSVTPDGGTAISKSLTGDWADYTYDVSADKVKTVTLGTDINGKRAYLSGFTITYAAQKVLSNIALSGTYPTSFTKGDAFSHSGMVVTANYSDSTSATVTASSTWSSPDMSTTGAKTITVSYSDEYGSASQTYSITVSYAAPTSITLSPSSTSVTLEETFDLSDVEVTINPSATADQTAFAWSLYDDDGLDDENDYVWIEPEIMSYVAGTFIFRCTSTESGSVYAEFTLTVSGDPIAHIKDESDHDVTEGSTTIYADAGVISYSVATENFQGSLTYTWSSSNPSAISVKESADEMCDYQVNAAGSARLSCRIQGSVKGDVTVYTDVTVSAVTVSSVTWTAPTIDVFSGATLSQADVTSWNVKYATNSGKTDQTAPVADIVIKLGGSAISIGHEWVAADSGKALSVEYGNVAAASTGSVTVTQSIHNVYAPVAGDPSTSTLTFTAACSGSGTSDGGETWTVTSDGTESTYDPTKGIHYGTGSAAVQYINLTSSDFTTGKITSVVVNASTASGVTATVAVNVGGSAFGGDAKSISQTATEYTFEGDVDADEIEVIITKPSSAAKAIYCKSIAVTYVEESEETVNIANVAAHKAAQRAAVAFANAFNAAMDETENCTTGLDAAWTTCSNAYNSFKTAAAALGETEEAWAKNLVKYATAQYSDDSGEACLERMMKTYEICVQKHGKTAFMSDLVSVGSIVNPINVISETGSTVAIVVVTSMIGLTAVGGYFFLRKRKENI